MRATTDNNDGTKAILSLTVNHLINLSRKGLDDADTIRDILDNVKDTLKMEEEDEDQVVLRRLKSALAPRNRVRVDKSLPKFYGNGSNSENIDDWIFQVNQFVAANFLEDHEVCKIIAPL